MFSARRLSLAFVPVCGLASIPAIAQDGRPSSAFPTTTFESGATSASVSDGAITARIALTGGAAVPVLSVSVGGVPVLEVAGIASGWDYPATEATIADIDPGNQHPEVIFYSYSGGAHCCTTVIIAEAVGEAWVAIPVGEFDGGGDYLSDLDHDGLVEIAVVDNRFLYQFDCYACSAAPLTVLTVRDGRVFDVSASQRYHDAHVEWLESMAESVGPADRWTSRGFLAGWMAAKIRVGEGTAAWEDLIAHWDFAADPGELTCTRGGEPEDCSEGDLAVLPFPERLKVFLDTNGYAF